MKNIIIVDMQKGFINQNNQFLIEKINSYLHLNCFENIFYTKCINQSGSPFLEIPKWNGMLKNEDQQIVVDILSNSTIFTKSGYGLTPDMIKCLKDKYITEIELCGTDIDACVMAISYNLFDNNIKPIILSSLCGSSSDDHNIIKLFASFFIFTFGDTIREFLSNKINIFIYQIFAFHL